jgi:hypothetical protein
MQLAICACSNSGVNQIPAQVTNKNGNAGNEWWHELATACHLVLEGCWLKVWESHAEMKGYALAEVLLD